MTVEGFNDLPATWATSTVGGLSARVVVGHVGPSSQHRDANGIPFLMGKNVRASGLDLDDLERVTPEFHERERKSQLTAGDLVVVRIGRSGTAAVVPDHICPANCSGLVVVKAPLHVDARYLAAYLNSPEGQSRSASQARGTTRRTLNTRSIEAALVPVAPRPEQHRIVEAIESYFTRLDDAVATLERVERNLKRYRASVLKAAVEGRLVPTEAELAPAEGRDYEPASGLLARILAERRRRWEEAELAKLEAKGKTPKNDEWKAKYKEPSDPDLSDLPDLPQGWAWSTPDQICEAIVDCPHSTPKWSESGHVCVRTTEFRPGQLDLSSARYVSEEVFLERVKRLRPREGDVLYSREGGILGIACCVPPGVELCMGQRMMLLRPVSSVPHEYLMMVLNSPFILEIVRRLTGGSAAPHVNVGEVRSFPVPLPPQREAVRIVEQVNDVASIGDVIALDTARNQSRIRQLRQSILMWAFEGKLVDQDPSDEPAQTLLDRIADAREAAASTNKTKKRGRKKTRSAQP